MPVYGFHRVLGDFGVIITKPRPTVRPHAIPQLTGRMQFPILRLPLAGA